MEGSVAARDCVTIRWDAEGAETDVVVGAEVGTAGGTAGGEIPADGAAACGRLV